MHSHSFKEWVAATRYWSFPVSAMPVIVTFAYLFSRNQLPVEWRSLAIFMMSVCGVVILHAAGNLLSDWADYCSGVDNENAYAVPNLVFGRFEPKEYAQDEHHPVRAGVLDRDRRRFAQQSDNPADRRNRRRPDPPVFLPEVPRPG